MPRPRREDVDRRFWISACRWFSGWRTSLLVVKPETVTATAALGQSAQLQRPPHAPRGRRRRPDATHRRQGMPSAKPVRAPRLVSVVHSVDILMVRQNHNTVAWRDGPHLYKVGSWGVKMRDA